MFWFITTIVFTAISVPFFIKGHITVDAGMRSERDLPIRWMGAIPLTLALIIFALTVITVVPTRNIGVTTAFGRPTGTLTNGLHLVAPWEDVTTYDATIQTLDSELQVRIANGATAKMKTTVHWRIDPKADIQQLHLDWREFSRLQGAVVVPRLQNVLNKTFESYDPLIALKESGGKPQPLSAMESTVKSQLQLMMPTGIIVDLVQLPFVEYPGQVQEALNNFQKELAATQVAIQQKQTALAQKEALDILNQAKLTPEAFSQQCLIMTERLAQQGKSISAMWTCVTSNAGAALALR